MKKDDPKERIIDLREKITRLETHPDSRGIIGHWNNFSNMTDVEKLSIYKDWDRYFNEVKESTSYKRWLAQKEAFSNGDFKTVKELSEHARSDKTLEIKKPKSQDPRYMMANQYVRMYEAMKLELSDLLDSTGSSGAGRDVYENIL